MFKSITNCEYILLFGNVKRTATGNPLQTYLQSTSTQLSLKLHFVCFVLDTWRTFSVVVKSYRYIYIYRVLDKIKELHYYKYEPPPIEWILCHCHTFMILIWIMENYIECNKISIALFSIELQNSLSRSSTLTI